MSNLGPVTIDVHNRFNFGGPRIRPIQGICIHTTENPFTSAALAVADYQINSRTGSYHRLVDDAGQIVLCNTDDWITWSTGNQGNDVLLHVSAVAYAASTREQWLAHPRLLDGIAKVVAHWATLHAIPLVKLTDHQLMAGQRGIVGHAETRIWGGTDHTDPGAGFPYDIIITKAKAIIGGQKAPGPSDTRSMDKLILDQLVGPEQENDVHNNSGWPQLGNRTLVDAVAAIGEHLDIPGFKAPK